MCVKPTTSRVNTRKVLVVDDHPAIRKAVGHALSNEPDMEVCGECESVSEAFRMVDQTHPDVVVVDLVLGDGNGLDLIKDLRIRSRKTKILVLSMCAEEAYVERVLRAGARGYVSKGSSLPEIVTAIRRVLGGEVCVSPKMTAKLMGRLIEGGEQEEESPLGGLSDRELQIFEMIGQGQPVWDIARTLHISPKTVESHREHIKSKLGLSSAPALMRYAINWVPSRSS